MILKKQQKKPNKKFLKRKLLAFPLILCLALTLSLGFDFSKVFGAGYVTDDLTVKIGYWGMDASTYVTKGTYNWYTLASSLPLHQQAYSFYQENKYGYNAVIDSAKGFYISDLLSYAGIERSGVSSISFYTKDKDVGYFTSFSYGELFNTTRYYFQDLSGNLRPTFEDAPDEETTTPTETTEPTTEETTTEPTTQPTTEPTTKKEDTTAPAGETGLIDKIKGHIPVETVFAADTIGDQKKYKLISVSDTVAWKHCNAVQPMLALEDKWESYETTSYNQPKNTAPSYSDLGTSNRFRLLFGQSSPKESKTSQTAKYVHTLLVTYKGVPEVVKDDKNISGDLGQHTISFKVAAGDTGMVKSLINEMGWNSSNEDVLKVDNVNMSESSEYADVVDVEITYTIKKKGSASIKGTYAGIEVGGSAISTGEDSTGGDGSGGNGSGQTSGENKSGSDTKGDSGSKAKDTAKKGSGEKKSSEVYELDKSVAKMLTQTATDVAQTDKETLKVKDKENNTGPYTAGAAAALCCGGVVAERIRFRKKL